MEAVADGAKALTHSKRNTFDVAIIDLGLPQMSGMQLLEWMREHDKTYPILVLTARSSWRDKVAALKAGADDYMVKPFHAEELLARINVLIRRASGFAKPTIAYGPIKLDTVTQDVSVSDQVLELTGYEYKTLEYFMLHAEKLVTRQELGEHVYAEGEDPSSNVLDVFVGRLRRKLRAHGADHIIQTVRGRGYRLHMTARDE